MAGPELPDDVQFSDLDRPVRARLRTLSKDNAEQVGRHLVMAGRLLDTDPELAYEHAQAAVRRAGRVDVVREAAGLAAYRTGRFAEALRELRTVRRLNGSSEHLAVMADCERGLGRPERAIALAASDEAESLDPVEQVELAMVVSGARLDLGEPEAALAVLSTGAASRVTAKDGLLGARVAQARASALEALGRHDDAAAALAGFSAAELAEAAGEVETPVVVFDLAEEPHDDDSGGAPTGRQDRADVAHETDAGEARDLDGPAARTVDTDGEPDAESSDDDDAEVPGMHGVHDGSAQAQHLHTAGSGDTAETSDADAGTDDGTAAAESSDADAGTDDGNAATTSSDADAGAADGDAATTASDADAATADAGDADIDIERAGDDGPDAAAVDPAHDRDGDA